MIKNAATGLMSLSIIKGVDSRVASCAQLTLEVEGIGAAYVDLDTEEFLRLMGGSMLPVAITWVSS